MTKVKDNKEFKAIELKTTEIIETSLSSVEIKRTTKGTNISVKVYNENPKTAQSLATKIYNDLDKKYKVMI